ncbi:MAG: HAD family hydrolase [Chloroflexi bacterium]|nr:HAD family hydrolase [Chloroflexota bacterium]
MLKAILFDMDDTLIDWSQRAEDWTDYNRRHMGRVFEQVRHHLSPQHDEDAFHDEVWKRTLETWASARETLRAPHIGTILVDTCLHFGATPGVVDQDELVDIFDWEPFPGVVAFDDALEVLPMLRQHQVRLGVVTNAFQPMRMRMRELKTFGLLDFLEHEACISAADIGYLKPHHTVFQAALAALEIVPTEAVFVGDTLGADIAGAKNLGMRAVLRINGDITAGMEATPEPDARINTLHELLPLLDAWYPDWRC